MTECLLKLRAGAEMFYDLRHQEIYSTFLYLHGHSKPIDLILVHDYLKTKDLLDHVGGVAYLSQLPDACASALNLPEYIDIVQRKHLLRTIIRTCTDTAAAAYEVNGEAREFLDRFEAKSLSIRGATEPLSGFIDLLAIRGSLLQDYDNAQTKQRPMGMPTGFDDLDRISGGMMDQEMIVLAGLRSTGKTSLATSIAFNVARSGTGVGFISLETSGKKIVHRMACAAGHVDGSKLLAGSVSAAESQATMAGFSRLISCADKLLISDAGPLSPEQLCSVCRRMYQKGARLFIVDYLQLLNCPGQKEYDRATYASRAIKNLGKEMNCPVIVLSSLNRESDKDQRRPRLSDLRASGQIEYDADKVWLLSNDSKQQQDELARRVILDVVKNKDGPTKDCRLMFFASEFRMQNAARIDDRDVQAEFIDAPNTPYPD